MEVIETAISDVKIIKVKRYEDIRGFFSETYNKKDFEKVGLDIDFVQDNISFSRRKGTIRGLHFQIDPFVQTKLIRVLRGAVFDVAVDLRRGSPTFGNYVHVTLDAWEGKQVLIPGGFAHGFCTLEDETEVMYKVSSFYAPECERGILWNDPDLNIRWPIEGEVILGDKDRRWPRFSEIPSFFKMVGI